MSRFVRRVESIVPRKAREYGGKAKNLAALARAGFPVPACFALSLDACRAHVHGVLPEADRPAALLDLPEATLSEVRLTEIARRVREAPLPADVEHALRHAFRELVRDGARSVAVRSSSSHEDDEQASAAGLHVTVLSVDDERALLDAARRCFASLFSPRVLGYLRGVGTGHGIDEPGVGLIVQAMVPADASGVMFTVDPLTGDPSEIVINATLGLGTMLVDGRVSPDVYRIDKASGFVRDRIIGDKTVRVVVEEHGVREETVPEADRGRPALDERTLATLIALGRRVEGHFEDARDVEWAVAGGTVYVLQARPVTAIDRVGAPKRPLRKAGDPRDRARIVWSNVNVGEALPGVATPLTWSILRDFSELGFRRAFGALGCAVPKDAELVGSFRGRIYLNMTEFMSIASQVPGLRPRTLLSLGGGGEIERLELDVEDRSKAGFFLRLPLTTTRFVRENFRIARRVEEFEGWFGAERSRVHAIDLRLLSPAALAKLLVEIDRILDASGAIMLTCYGNLLLAVVVLRSVLRLVAGERAEALERGLFTGLADVESAAPGIALWHIAEMGERDPQGRDAILATSDLRALRVESLPDGPIRRALENFLRAYGYRGAREAEVAEPRWREDPSFLFATLRVHWGRRPGAPGPLDLERQRLRIRDESLAELERLVPGPARVAVRHLLTLVHRFMRLRERLRAHVTEVLGMFRTVALDASRRLAAREAGLGHDAAFFLAFDELREVLAGDARPIGPIVRRRRIQLERDRALPDPPDTFVGFPPPPAAPPADTGALTGLGASSGRVEGIARVLMTPAEADAFQPGEILVAPYADVGWSPLFLAAAAVVTDLGGPLSHAAIVAREYGVPAVVNVKIGTRVIRTGDRLVVDGDAGTVQVETVAATAAAHDGARATR